MGTEAQINFYYGGHRELLLAACGEENMDLCRSFMSTSDGYHDELYGQDAARAVHAILSYKRAPAELVEKYEEIFESGMRMRVKLES